MLNKETFLKYMSEIKELDDKDLKINDFVSNNFELGYFSVYDKPINYMIDMLSRLMEIPTEDDSDPYYMNDISYFVLELNFGRDPGRCENCIQWEDGREFSIYTPEDLYDYLLLLKLDNEEKKKTGDNDEKKHNFY